MNYEGNKMLFLKQSTAISVKIGPFIDDTDGKTAEVALTLTQADIRLSKNGANIAQKTEANDATTDELGYYDCPIDATDTGTLGRLQLFVHEAGALPVFHEYMVVPANVWDSLFGADKLDVNTAELANIDFGATMKASLESAVDAALENDIPAVPTAGSINDVLNDLDTKFPTNKIMGSSVVTDKDDEIDAILSAANVAAAYSIVNSGIGFRGTVTAANPGVSFTIGTLAGLGAGFFVDANSPWYATVLRDAGGVAGAPQGEAQKVTGYTTATGLFTSDAFTVPVAVGDDVLILNRRLADISSILADTNELQTDWVNGGRLDLLVDAIKAITDLLTLAAIADAVHDEAVEGAYTERQLLKIISAAVAGKTSEAVAGTMVVRDVNDSANRISATMDANRYRTAVALTV
jgi:hypothetical protein